PTSNMRCLLLASAALTHSSPLSTSARAKVIHWPPSFALGTIIRRFPASATVIALFRTVVHSSLFFGPRSTTPSLVSIQPDAPQTSSAAGSRMSFINSLTSATGLNGGGCVLLHAPHRQRETDARSHGASRIEARFQLLSSYR